MSEWGSPTESRLTENSRPDLPLPDRSVSGGYQLVRCRLAVVGNGVLDTVIEVILPNGCLISDARLSSSSGDLG